MEVKELKKSVRNTVTKLVKKSEEFTKELKKEISESDEVFCALEDIERESEDLTDFMDEVTKLLKRS